jgi:hypothetical protein
MEETSKHMLILGTEIIYVARGQNGGCLSDLRVWTYL